MPPAGLRASGLEPPIARVTVAVGGPGEPRIVAASEAELRRRAAETVAAARRCGDVGTHRGRGRDAGRFDAGTVTSRESRLHRAGGRRGRGRRIGATVLIDRELPAGARCQTRPVLATSASTCGSTRMRSANRPPAGRSDWRKSRSDGRARAPAGRRAAAVEIERAVTAAIARKLRRGGRAGGKGAIDSPAPIAEVQVALRRISDRRAGSCGVLQRRDGGAVAQDQIAGLLADHDRGGVGVRGRHPRHDRGIAHPQAIETSHPQVRIDHRQSARCPCCRRRRDGGRSCRCGRRTRPAARRW